MSWVQTPFEEILADSKDGEWGEGEEAPGLRQCLVVRGTDFADLDNPSKAFPLRWIKNHIVDRKRLQPGDIILEAAGGTSNQSTGRTTLLRDSFFHQHHDLPILCASFSRHLRLKQEFSPVFVYHLLQMLYRSGYMAVYNIQHTGISRFQYTSFKKHTRLLLPDLPNQCKIAAILTAYDDLIETNKSRIALLEKMAEEIYREWFVRMRFPGYQDTKFVKGVPEAWEIKRLGDILELAYGKALTESDREPGVFHVYGSGGIVGSHSKPLVKGKGIIVGRKGNVGAVYFSDRGFFPIDTVFYVVSVLPLSFLFFLLRTMNFINNDAAVPGLNRNQAYANPILYPGHNVIEQFARIADPIFDMKHQLIQQNCTLIRTRDLLLPRLISGKLSVADLDIQFPPSMREDDKDQSQGDAP